MTIDTTKTIYVGVDILNAEVKVLLPKNCDLDVVELRLNDPDAHGPNANDGAVFDLAEEEMIEHTFEI